MTSEEEVSEYDNYGFPSEYKYDRSKDHTVLTPSVSTKGLFIKIVIALLIILLITSMGISGYYAWMEYPSDPTWLKVIRLYIAIIFAPLYIFYIFMKTTVFK